MDERYKLAILRLPENEHFIWVKYLSKAYRQEHVINKKIDDIPSELLSIVLYHTHPTSQIITHKKKLQQFEAIILDLFLLSSHDLLDEFEESTVPLEYKLDLMKKARKKGAEILYYRFVLRALINSHRLARDVLKLDRDEELEAVHHLYREKNSNPQINFEIGVWKSIEDKHQEAAYHFTELYKTLPSNYVPKGDPSKICTLTIEKLKGYLGIVPERMETEQDESYARELFHYSKELEGKRRVHRDQVDTQDNVDLDMLNQNLDIIKARIEQDSLGDQFFRARRFLKAAIRLSKGYAPTARKAFEEILSRITENDLHLWTNCIYCCAILTPIEETPSEKYYESLKEIIASYGYPTIKEWTFLLALNIQFPLFAKFVANFRAMKLPEEIENLANCVDRIVKLSAAQEPYSSDFLSDVYLGLLDCIEKCEIKSLEKMVEYFQDASICKKISKWLFTAVRVLKFIHKERQSEADAIYSYFELISFEPEFIIDIPTDVDYKIKTGIHDYSKIMRLTKAIIARTKRLLPDPYNDYFLGNLFLLEEKFSLAIKEYLRAARVLEIPKLFKRLIYSVMKVGALFEGVILYQLTDADYSLEKAKPLFGNFPLQKFLFTYIVDVDMIEFIIEKNKGREDIVEMFLKLLESPERHQSGNTSRVKKNYQEKMLDLLHFSIENNKN